ncbi:MAG: RluA family pseudouridine synthase [Planctomycetia bacterium]|nr:RluA family pseudouridine synthase [Planctomycetia bacterium]
MSSKDRWNQEEPLEPDQLDEVVPLQVESSWQIPEQPGEVARRVVDDSQAGWRLDQFLAAKFPQYSRVFLRKIIQAETGVDVDGLHGKPSFRLKPGSVVSFRVVEPPRESPIPENIPLDILYEDDDLAVVNKPADMVVHPSRGHWSGTLVSALAYHFAGQLSSNRGPARPGIVHRLDRDTSGAIIIAKNDQAHAGLAALFETKKIQKEYFAIVLGNLNADREIVDKPIGLHPRFRVKMAIAEPTDPNAKPAQTYFETIERFRGFSTMKCLPKTGRTHQIRVHLTSLGLPILCDKLYGGRAEITVEELQGKVDRFPKKHANGQEAVAQGRLLLARQALHARKITFTHPRTGQELEIEAPLPSDLQNTLDALRQYRAL